MPQFHETGYGKKFFEYQLPKLIKAIEKIGAELEMSNIRAEDKLTTPYGKTTVVKAYDDAREYTLTIEGSSIESVKNKSKKWIEEVAVSAPDGKYSVEARIENRGEYVEGDEFDIFISGHKVQEWLF